MAKKKKNTSIGRIKIHEMTKEESEHMARFLGMVAGHISKFLLEQGGCQVDYKINGEDISTIQELSVFDIAQRIDLAVREERYEDAAKLKKLLIDGGRNIKS